MSEAKVPMYDGPVIDTHHHIWRHKDVAWLQPPVTEKLFGDYFSLRRDFPIEEWMHDVTPHNVVKTVHVTANWGVPKSLDETRWLDSVADQHGFPHAFSAQVDLTDENAGALLDGLAKFKRVRGVRHQLYWESNPLWQVTHRPDVCNTPEFRRGFKLLEKHGFHFELQVFGSQARFAADLVKAFPGVKFILLHSGMLTDHSSPLVVQQWRDGLSLLAESPNVHVKISGLGMYTHSWTVPQMRQAIRDSIQIFGADRTIYGSNFPLEKIWCSYADLIGAYRKIMSEYSLDVQRKVFHDNATSFYRM